MAVELAPDDPRKNPELHQLVQQAVHKAGAELMQTFDPVANGGPVYVKDRLIAVRKEVISKYQANQASKEK